LQYFEAFASSNPKQIMAKLQTFSKKSKKVTSSFEIVLMIDDSLKMVPPNY
jgi:hypothetical protein